MIGRVVDVISEHVQKLDLLLFRVAVFLGWLVPRKRHHKLRSQSRGLQAALSSHPCIIGCYGVCFQTTDLYVFAQELSPLGDLFALIEDQVGIPERMVKHCADQVASALDFMHSKGLIHRDVKPENVLVFDTECLHVKLTDFGMTRLKGTTVHGRTGTVPYMAPELCQPALMEADSPLDVWEFGVLIFTVLTGTFPWEEAVLDNDYQAFEEWMKMGVGTIPSRWKRLTLESLTMFGSLLKHDPLERGSIFEHQKFLEIPWTVNMILNDGIDQDGRFDGLDPVSSATLPSWSEGSLLAEERSKDKEATDIGSRSCSIIGRANSETDASSEAEPPEARLVDWRKDSASHDVFIDGSLLFVGAEVEVS